MVKASPTKKRCRRRDERAGRPRLPRKRSTNYWERNDAQTAPHGNAASQTAAWALASADMAKKKKSAQADSPSDNSGTTTPRTPNGTAKKAAAAPEPSTSALIICRNK